MDLTRRYFLQSAGAAAAYLGIAPVTALAASAGCATVLRGRTLVVLFLRGGADGLNLIVPHGDPHYRTLRPTIGVPGPAGSPEGGAIDLDGFFGLHPRLAPLHGMFRDGSAVALHAVGYDQNTRSHFEEQDVWETGVIGNTVHSDGWLNRHLATSTGHGPIRAVSVGDALPRILQGDEAALAIRGLDALGSGTGDRSARIFAALEHAYQSDPAQHTGAAEQLLADAGSATIDGLRLLRGIAANDDAPGAVYPQTALGRQLRSVARLIKAEVGLEVAEVSLGGWDTHARQGPYGGGVFGNLAGTLALAVAAFMKDLGDRSDDVLVVTMTDFGRTAAENGSLGTDHGWANCMMLLGGSVWRANQASGGARMVLGDWPGLGPDQLNQGRDLLHTTDFRDVLAELVRVHLGNDKLETVLPGHTFRPVGAVL